MSRPARNTDYRKALAVLLDRLRDMDAVIEDALVDSAFTQRSGIPESDRQLIRTPIRLIDEPDVEALRLKLTSAQLRIGRSPNTPGGGNSSKRIRLRLRVAGFSPHDASLLADELTRPRLDSPANKSSGEIQQIEHAVALAAGKPIGPSRGQGFQLDQAVKVAVEHLAMRTASEFYRKDWDVEDVHGAQSYDLICRRNGEAKHIEVKGTTTSGTEVILTPNEVKHARTYPHTALFVLSDIIIERLEDGTVTATGGKIRLYDPWLIDDGTLVPLGFRYLVPHELGPSE